MLSSILNVIIMFSCDLLQVNAMLGSLLCGCESPCVGPFCAVSVMSRFFLSARFRRAVGVIASTEFSLWKWIQRATAKQKSDEHDFAACKSTGFAAAGGRHRFLFSLIPSLSAVSTAAIINFLHHPDCSVSVHLYSKTC